jgi:secretion/DNA translocation related TadE-like protein
VGEEGSVGVLLLAVAAVTLIVSLAVVAVGQLLVGYAEAEAAADAAALAAAPVTFRPFGATGTAAQEAARFAAVNQATLVGCSCRSDPSWEPRTVVVTVRRTFGVLLFGEQSVEATSRAEFVPTRLLE